MQESNRHIYWIDAIKALSIIFVYFAHAQYFYHCKLPILNKFINPWYVNAFFFVSGYLLFWKQLSEPKIYEDRKTYIHSGGGRALFYNILFRIIIPSIIFSIIEFVPSCLFQGRSINVGYALQKTLGGGTYWFTSALVVAELLLLVLFCTRIRSVWFYAAICLVMSCAGLMIVRLGILHGGFWAWRQGLLALVFLAMGGIYWRFERQIDKFTNLWVVVVLLGIYVVTVLHYKESNSLISTLRITPIGFMTSAIACLLLILLCKRLPESELLSFIGQKSLGFYFVSGALPVMLSFFAHRMIDGSPVWMMIIIWVISLILAYLIVWIINKWAPCLLDVRNKNQNQPIH